MLYLVKGGGQRTHSLRGDDGLLRTAAIMPSTHKVSIDGPGKDGIAPSDGQNGDLLAGYW